MAKKTIKKTSNSITPIEQPSADQVEHNNAEAGDKWRKAELGALCEAETKTGAHYLRGYIVNKDGSRERVLCFLNEAAAKDEEGIVPIYRIYRSN